MISIKSNAVAIGNVFRRTFPRRFRRSNIRLLTVATNLLHANVVASTPVGASKGAGLKASIQAHVDSRKLVGTVFTPKSYAEAVEFGAAPHWPPIAALERWGRIVLKTPGLGFVLARAISIRGTRGYGMFSKGRQESDRPITVLFQRGLVAFEREMNGTLNATK